MAAGRQAGAERGQADRGGARAGRRDVADRAGERGEGRRQVGVRAQQIGAEAVDEQDGHPAGTREGRGEAERVGGQSVAVHRDAECGRGARQHVGEGGLAVARGGAGRRAGSGRRRSRAGGQDVQAGGDVAVGRGLGEGELEVVDGGRVGAGVRLQQVGDDGDAAPCPGGSPAPSTRASSSAGSKRRRPGGRGAGRGRGPREGQRLDRVAAQGPGEDGAGTVGRAMLTVPPGRTAAAISRSVIAGSSTTSSTEWHSARSKPPRRAGQHLVQQVAVALDAADALADPGGLGPPAQRRQRVGAGVDDGDVVPGRASGTANVPLPPPTSRTRSVPAVSTGSRADHTAAVRGGAVRGGAGGDRHAAEPSDGVGVPARARRRRSGGRRRPRA